MELWVLRDDSLREISSWEDVVEGTVRKSIVEDVTGKGKEMFVSDDDMLEERGEGRKDLQGKTCS